MQEFSLMRVYWSVTAPSDAGVAKIQCFPPKS